MIDHNLVVPLEMSKEMKELGFNQKGMFYWWECYYWDNGITKDRKIYKSIYIFMDNRCLGGAHVK